MRELDQTEFKIKSQSVELESALKTIKNYEQENQKLKTKVDERNDEIKDLTNEKYVLIRELRENDLEFQSFNVEIQSLRRKMEDRDKELSDTMHLANEKEKELEAEKEKENRYHGWLDS